MTSNETERNENFNLENFLNENKITIALGLLGVILVGFGALLIKNNGFVGKPKIEVLNEATESESDKKELVVEVVGAVEKPGVFSFSDGDRIEDALIAAGGVSKDADRNWMERVLNRAAKLVDGQKIYIPRVGEEVLGKSSQNTSGGEVLEDVVNINSASQKVLESLWGIGPVTAQNIIEQRPYSSVEELLSKKILKENVYEKNKEKLTVY